MAVESGLFGHVDRYAQRACGWSLFNPAARRDPHMPERAIAASQPRRVTPELLSARQARQDVVRDGAIRTKFRNAVADVILGGIAEKVELGPVGLFDPA